MPTRQTITGARVSAKPFDRIFDDSCAEASISIARHSFRRLCIKCRSASCRSLYLALYTRTRDQSALDSKREGLHVTARILLTMRLRSALVKNEPISLKCSLESLEPHVDTTIQQSRAHYLRLIKCFRWKRRLVAEIKDHELSIPFKAHIYKVRASGDLRFLPRKPRYKPEPEPEASLNCKAVRSAESTANRRSASDGLRRRSKATSSEKNGLTGFEAQSSARQHFLGASLTKCAFTPSFQPFAFPSCLLLIFVACCRLLFTTESFESLLNCLIGLKNYLGGLMPQ